MEELRNLKQICSSAASRFNQYEGKDFVLPQVFKEQVKEINSNTITYNEYSAVIETRGNQNGVLNIFLPNQWFYIASYFTEFYNELLKYKKEALKVVSKERLKDLNGRNLTDAEMSRLNSLSLDDTSKSYLVKFITDYTWWNGAKTIDRGDFYVSPILNSARLVNASQTFVADLCAFLADKQFLVRAIISGEETESIPPKELVRIRAAATFLKKALKKTLDMDSNLNRLTHLNRYETTTKQLKINGFPIGRDKEQLPPRLEDVYMDIEWSYNDKIYVLYLEWTPEMMESMFFPVYNEAYNGMFRMEKDATGEYVLYEEYQIKEKKVIKDEELLVQQIYFGTPGSGKSWTIKRLYEMRKDGDKYVEDEEKKKHVIRTTFHPDTDYASFVGCYKPVKDEDDDKKIVYEFVPQAFTDAYVAAWNDLEHPYYLIIEEINRGNCAQIFGDLFQLLDRDKNGYSEYRIKADHDLKDYLVEHLPEDNEGIKDGKLCLPPNLSIIASMNTSDQSLFPMDSAFKRRWSWEYVPIDYENAESGKFEITIGEESYNWHKFLKAVNEKIKNVTSSEDKQMGNFFIKSSIDEKEFCDKVMFYLWSEIGKDNYNTKDAIFKYYEEEDKQKEFSFNELYDLSKRTEILKGFIRYIEEEK